jgi:hypothetical protein
MAGIARIVIGVVLVVIGIPFLLLFFLGLIFIILGIVLIASGASARGDEQRLLASQQQTNMLLQQQLQMTAMQANRQQVIPPEATYSAQPQGTPQPAAPSPGAGGFCPYCGAVVAQGYAFCKSCGKAIPK